MTLPDIGSVAYATFRVDRRYWVMCVSRECAADLSNGA